MVIRVNGARETLNEPLTLQDFLLAKEYPLEAVVVERNGVLVSHPDWPQILLSENDTLEILRFVGGG